jgi:hypothetical protein
MPTNGIRNVDGINVLPLDGLWEHLRVIPSELKIKEALSYAGCEFHDDDKRFVRGHSISLAGIGGVPIAHVYDSDAEITASLRERILGTRELMGSAAAFSYLNSGEKDIYELYDSVTKLGHFSIAHAIQVNIIIAGISEGAELELNLQRDLVHFSKLTNARTRVQNSPPIVVPEGYDPALIESLYRHSEDVAASIRQEGDADSIEYANSLFPVNKATILMISGDLSNLRKISALRKDIGKEKELRTIAAGIFDLLSSVWPEVINE